MTKLQLLHRALNERLMAAVEQIMEMVGDTVLEYEEETIRARKENEVLRRRLRWMEGANRADWPGPSEPVTLSTMDEANPSRQDECAVNFGFGQELEALEIKTETTDLPLCIRPESSVTTLPQSIDQGSDNAGTGAGIAYGLTDSMTWDSAQSYMAPLDFDPTSGPTRVRRWRGRNRRQRMSFACPDCGKIFGREQRLIIHMRIHSTERPYAYRRRKACFYGDNKKKRKLHRLSQLSREIVDDLSDGSEQTNRSSASSEQLETTAPGQEEEPESDHTSSDKPEKRITTPVRNQRNKKRVVNQIVTEPTPCQCPHCPHRMFARPCQLAMHMKTHTVTALTNLPTQAQSGTREIVDVKRKLPKDELNTLIQLQPIYEENKKATTEADAVSTVAFVSNRCFSKVWDYFSKDAYGEVFCHACSGRVSQGSSKASQKNTSNLWSHLRINHRHAYLEAKRYSRPVNMLINTLDTSPLKLEYFEPEERIVEGEGEIKKVMIPEEPSNGTL